MIRFFVGLLLIVGAMALAIALEGGTLGQYVGLTAFIITFFVPVFAVLSVWGFRDWGRSWSAAFKPSVERDAALRARQLWNLFERTSYLAGILGMILSLILVLSTQNDLGTALRPLALCVLPGVYGLVFGLAALILRARVDSLQK